MAVPITLKGLDDIVENGGSLQFIGVGPEGKSCEYWIAVGLPADQDEQAFVLVSFNNPKIRTLRGKQAIDSIIERYPNKRHIQTMLLPLRASIEKPDAVYLLSRKEIEALDSVEVISRKSAPPET